MLASPPLLAPNAGSETVFDHPTAIPFILAMYSWIFVANEGESGQGRPGEGNAPRARNLSSDRIAMAFTSNTETKDLVSICSPAN